MYEYPVFCVLFCAVLMDNNKILDCIICEYHAEILILLEKFLACKNPLKSKESFQNKRTNAKLKLKSIASHTRNTLWRAS